MQVVPFPEENRNGPFTTPRCTCADPPAAVLCLPLALLTVHADDPPGPGPVDQPARPRNSADDKAARKARGRPERQALATVAVKLSDGVDATAVARRHGATVDFQLASLPGWYQLRFADAPAAESALPALVADADVIQARQQYQSRAARKTNDTYYSQQWHLENTGQSGGTAGKDVKPAGAWAANYTGSGVMVSIVDDGVETAHPDLAAGYNPAYAYDYVDNDANPNPVLANDTHGTAVGGLAIARGENSLGVAGVAYNANWTAVRLLGTGISDSTEASALGHALANVDVYNNSWGAPDTGDYEEIGPLAKAAIENGVATGRGGKGAIYVWAGGNGDAWGDDSNLDGYAAMPETIATAAINDNFNGSSYSEAGANILVTAPGGESDMFTSDITGAGGYNDGTVFADSNYTNDFDGTSAATPVVTGVVALMLQANPNLTWRDVQHILVNTSDHSTISGTSSTNAAGFQVSDRWGFGVVRADRAASLASAWSNVPARQTLNSPVDSPNTPIPDASALGVIRSISVPSNLYIEHVVVEFTTNHTYWGDLRITLTAPSSTVSRLAVASGGWGPASSSTWRFLSTRHWGEQAQGNWTLRVVDEVAVDIGDLQSWRIYFYGTATPPNQPASIANTSLSDGTTGLGYNHAFQYNSTSTQVVWSLSGSVPPGLSINTANGVLSGTLPGGNFQLHRDRHRIRAAIHRKR